MFLSEFIVISVTSSLIWAIYLGSDLSAFDAQDHCSVVLSTMTSSMLMTMVTFERAQTDLEEFRGESLMGRLLCSALRSSPRQRSRCVSYLVSFHCKLLKDSLHFQDLWCTSNGCCLRSSAVWCSIAYEEDWGLGKLGIDPMWVNTMYWVIVHSIKQWGLHRHCGRSRQFQRVVLVVVTSKLQLTVIVLAPFHTEQTEDCHSWQEGNRAARTWSSRSLCCSSGGAHGGGHGGFGACRRIAAALCSVPAATARPCATGQWVPTSDQGANAKGASINVQRTLSCSCALPL